MSVPAHNETTHPHSPDVLERHDSDKAFSKGWGLHQQPAESYLIDCHTHMAAKSQKDVQRALDEFFARAGAMRLRRVIALDGKPENVEGFSKVSAKDDRFLWLVWPSHREPDLAFFKKASAKPGFAGLKLHNSAMIKSGDSPDMWLSSAWDEMFEFCAEVGKPVLWHVTQRMTDCPYMGGGRNSYWKEGWKNGTTYGNQEVMDVFLEQVARHRKTRFIGAHHLHIGPDYAGALFEEHANLFADLSCGNIVRFCDDMYEADRAAWKAYFTRFPDRLMFGTDCALGGQAGEWYLWETLAAHIRFLHQVRLPQDLLDNIACRNIEAVFGLSPVELHGEQWCNVRP